MTDRDANSRTEAGEQMYARVYGDFVPPLQARDDRPAAIRHLIDHLFGEIWTDEVLSVRDRRLMVIGVLCSMGLWDVVKIQFKSALRDGEMTAQQIEAIPIFLSHYVGFPRMGGLIQTASAAIEECAATSGRP